MYNETIIALLQQIEIIPYELAVLYLQKIANITENLASQSIYKAGKARACVIKDNYIAKNRYVERDSAAEKKIKAFRIILEFLPESSTFCKAKYPWIFAFTKGSKLVQICTISSGMEFIESKMIAESETIHKDEQGSIVRIAIVEPDCNIANIKKAGFSYFCTVDETYKMNIIHKVKESEAWNDVLSR